MTTYKCGRYDEDSPQRGRTRSQTRVLSRRTSAAEHPERTVTLWEEKSVEQPESNSRSLGVLVTHDAAVLSSDSHIGKDLDSIGTEPTIYRRL